MAQKKIVKPAIMAQKRIVKPAQRIRLSEQGLLHTWYSGIINANEYRSFIGLPPKDESGEYVELPKEQDPAVLNAKRWKELNSGE